MKDDNKYEFLWLGTKQGPERQMVERAGIKFRAISGGKWRRYFSLKNLIDILKIKLAIWQAFFIMLKWRPDLVMGAGSFISAPVVWAAWLLRLPVLIHQQDVMPGLANKLMAPFAKVVTVSFEKSLKDYGKKAVWTGNPIRRNFQFSIFPPEADLSAIREDPPWADNFQFNKLNNDLPVVLFLGGGTGAMAINRLVAESLGELTKFCQLMHITGKNKRAEALRPNPLFLKQRGYFAYEFLEAEKMAEALKLADVVVTRAGMSTLTELSYLGKPAIIIPLPDSHQEENAKMFKEAAMVLEQKDLTKEMFTHEIKKLIENKELQKELGEKIGQVMKRGANETMAKVVLELLK